MSVELSEYHKQLRKKNRIQKELQQLHNEEARLNRKITNRKQKWYDADKKMFELRKKIKDDLDTMA